MATILHDNETYSLSEKYIIKHITVKGGIGVYKVFDRIGETTLNSYDYTIAEEQILAHNKAVKLCDKLNAHE